jgi:hypothetical protein
VIIAKRMTLLILAVALAACGSRTYDDPIKITSQFNPDGAYGTYKTWDFAKYKNLPTEGVLADASFRLELANMIEEALKQYQLVRVFENPDLEVGFHVAADQIGEEELQSWFAEGDWNMPVYSGARRDEWRKGSLILFIFEKKSGQLLWRSSAEAIVDRSSSEKNRKQIVERAIGLMLAELPREKQE